MQGSGEDTTYGQQQNNEMIEPPEVMFATQYEGHSIHRDGVKVTAINNKDGTKSVIDCEALVGADGVSSKVRQDIAV